MDISLAIEYFTFIFITSFVTIQIVSSAKDKTYVRILRNQKLTIVLSLTLIILSFIWFFSSGDRNAQTYMEGGQISIVFGLGSFTAVVITKMLKSFYGNN